MNRSLLLIDRPCGRQKERIKSKEGDVGVTGDEKAATGAASNCM
jgi:hypothetical protein